MTSLTVGTSTQDIYAVLVKLPPSYIKDLEGWFLHVEAQFRIRGITCYETKFLHLCSALDLRPCPMPTALSGSASLDIMLL